MLQYTASIEPTLHPPPLALSLAVPSSSNDDVIPYTSRIVHVIPSLLTPINRHSSSPLHINPVPISIEMSPEHNQSRNDVDDDD